MFGCFYHRQGRTPYPWLERIYQKPETAAQLYE